MNKTLFSISTICLLLLSGLLVLPVSSTPIGATDTPDFDWYVDDVVGEGPDNPAEDFTSIQAAIDNATSGQSIFVYNGEYNENIVIDKPSLTLQGEDNENTKVSSNTKAETITLLADNITISNIAIISKNESSEFTFSIKSNNNIIKNNVILNNNDNKDAMISFFKSNYNEINNNTILGGVFLDSSNYNMIFNNDFSSSRSIYITSGSSYNNFSNNNILGNGIRIIGNCMENIIFHNLIKNCPIGLLIYHENNKILYNDFLSNYINANVEYEGNCYWYHNYWGGTKLCPIPWIFPIPKIIIGIGYYNHGVKFYFDIEKYHAFLPNIK